MKTLNQYPDHATLAAFRQQHLGALAGLFGQVLQLCQRPGLVTLGHVALGGTQVLANASKHMAMSYGRMAQAEPRLQREIAALLAEAQRVDAAEDVQYGPGRQGDELLAALARRESRLVTIRAAKAALEAEARAEAADAAAAAHAKLAARERRAAATGRKPSGAMRAKLQGVTGRAVYALRKAIGEPVFGQIKDTRGFRQFSFRGLAKVQAEWRRICLTHNLLKLFRAGWCPQAA